jgi:hypothetical protein
VKEVEFEDLTNDMGKWASLVDMGPSPKKEVWMSGRDSCESAQPTKLEK